MLAATSGYRNDGDSGLMHVGARYYDAQVGRFITRDSDLEEHPYLYCDHDPVNDLDPSSNKPNKKHHGGKGGGKGKGKGKGKGGRGSGGGGPGDGGGGSPGNGGGGAPGGGGTIIFNGPVTINGPVYIYNGGGAGGDSGGDTGGNDSGGGDFFDHLWDLVEQALVAQAVQDLIGGVLAGL